MTQQNITLFLTGLGDKDAQRTESSSSPEKADNLADYHSLEKADSGGADGGDGGGEVRDGRQELCVQHDRGGLPPESCVVEPVSASTTPSVCSVGNKHGVGRDKDDILGGDTVGGEPSNTLEFDDQQAGGGHGVLDGGDGVPSGGAVENTANDNVAVGGGTELCEFKKGICTLHNIKGKKIVTSSKKWTQKKDGYGWVTSRKVTYSCGYRTKARIVTPVDSTNESSAKSPVCSSSNGESNFGSSYGLSAGMKGKVRGL